MARVVVQAAGWRGWVVSDRLSCPLTMSLAAASCTMESQVSKTTAGCRLQAAFALHAFHGSVAVALRYWSRQTGHCYHQAEGVL